MKKLIHIGVVVFATILLVVLSVGVFQLNSALSFKIKYQNQVQEMIDQHVEQYHTNQ